MLLVAMDSTCIGNNQEQQQQQQNQTEIYQNHHHAEDNLLFDTLKNIWHNYLVAFNNVDVKVNYK